MLTFKLKFVDCSPFAKISNQNPQNLFFDSYTLEMFNTLMVDLIWAHK